MLSGHEFGLRAAPLLLHIKWQDAGSILLPTGRAPPVRSWIPVLFLPFLPDVEQSGEGKCRGLERHRARSRPSVWWEVSWISSDGEKGVVEIRPACSSTASSSMYCPVPLNHATLPNSLHNKLWLANFIDRTNVGNARCVAMLALLIQDESRLVDKAHFLHPIYRIAGLQTDTHLKGNQFNTALASTLWMSYGRRIYWISKFIPVFYVS